MSDPKETSPAAAKATEAWLDHMPALPLERSVPIVDIGVDAGLFRAERLVCLGAPNDTHGNTGGQSLLRGDVWPLHESAIRVDLDDPQGFGYALRVWRQAVPWDRRPNTTGAIIARWLDSKTTDDDRLQLAKGLSAVSR